MRNVKKVGCSLLAVLVFSVSAFGQLENRYTFDDPSALGGDASGNAREAFVNDMEVQWVEDEVRGGVIEFGGSTNGFVVAEIPTLEAFTIMTWAYRGSELCCGSGGANDGLFQVQQGTGDLDTLPTPSTSTKVVGAWVQKSDAAVWGRVINADGNQNLDRSFMMENDVWTHLAYRSDGETFEVVVNGESGIGPSLQYDSSTMLEHDTIYIGRQGTETWGGRMDDFRVYSQALSDEEIMAAMIGIAAEDAGDFNSDGEVNGDDFAILAMNFNQRFSTVESFSKGDTNVDGRVDLTDFLAFRVVFGERSSAGVASIPEPVGVTLVFPGLVGGALLLAARRKRRSQTT